MLKQNITTPNCTTPKHIPCRLSETSDDLTKKSKAEVDKSDIPETEKAGRKISRGGASQMRPSPKKQQQQKTAAFKTQQVEHLLS